MKRKLIISVMALAATFACALGISGCSLSSDSTPVAHEHDFTNGDCACGAKKPTDGLEYELSENKQFYICTGLGTATEINIVIADSVKDEKGVVKPVTEIDGFAFYNCSGLTSITIPNSVTYIGDRAFMDCNGLTSITIPDSVTTIGSSAFSGTAWYNNQPDGLVYAGKVVYKYKGTMLDNTSITLVDGTKGIANRAFMDCNGLTSVIIPDSVTSIGEWAFVGCSKLKSITIPDSVTFIGGAAFGGTAWYDNQPDGLVYAGKVAYDYKGTMPDNTSITLADGTKGITSSAFYNCKGLMSVTISDSVTSIGSHAFYNCSGLTSITIGKAVTSIGSGAFRDCGELTNINYTGDIASWCAINGIGNLMDEGATSKAFYIDGKEITGELIIPNSVTTIGRYAFYNCTGLTSLTIPDSVISIGGEAFRGCTGLTSVVIPDSVTSIGGDAFWHCSGLMSITIPDSVTAIGDFAFAYCSGLTSVTIPDSVTSIGEGVFRGCSGLTSVTIPDSVTSIGYGAFRACSGLMSITISDSVTSIGGYAFTGCSELTSINYTGDIAGWCAISGLDSLMGSDITLYIDGKEITGELIIPDSVTSIGEYAFCGCSGLTSITTPDSVTEIGSSAFSNTAWYDNQPDGLVYAGKVVYKYKGTMPDNTSITLEEGTKGIAGRAFYNCSKLTSITIPDSVTSVGGAAFAGCRGLTSVNYTGDIAGWCAISGLDSLMKCGTTDKTLYIDGKEIKGELIIPDSVTSIGNYAFSGCGELISVILPDSVTSIGDETFSGCSGLTSVTIGNSVTYISSYAFWGCSELTSINYTGDIAGWCAISGLVNLMRYNTSNKTLYIDGKELTKLTIPDSVTSIGWSAFEGCSGLTSVIIPDSVTYIGRYAFSSCSGLTSVYYKGTVDEWTKISISIDNNNLKSATRYYYSETEPTEEGNYWHYDSDGVTPVIWTK